jgi:hypothetical protein
MFPGDRPPFLPPPPPLPEYHMAGERCSRCEQLGVCYPPIMQAGALRIELIAVHHPSNNPLAGTYLTGYALGGPYQQRVMVESVNTAIGVIAWQPCGVQTLMFL